MALSNAERQRRWRARRKAQIQKLEVLTADTDKVARPTGTWDERDLKVQPLEVQKLYRTVDSMITFGAMAEMATITLRTDEIPPEHIDYAAAALASAERQLRELRAKIALSTKEPQQSVVDNSTNVGHRR